MNKLAFVIYNVSLEEIQIMKRALDDHRGKSKENESAAALDGKEKESDNSSGTSSHDR